MKLVSGKIMILPAAMLGVMTLAGAAAMIPGVQADDISPVDDEVTITVDSACTMGQTVLQGGNSLNPGETSTIGSSRIAAYCNDADGYAIYAIGYTGGEYGNTNMVSADGNHTIATGTGGTGSYWNMRLTPGAATGVTSYIPTVENTFLNNAAIPNDYTKVASYASTTVPQGADPTETGTYFTTSYQAHIATTQPAGVYTGQVQYVMVHPVGAPAPEKPLTMQETTKIKAKLTNVGDTMQATDARDGKKYWVTKLADGNIWMTQNLDFDIVNGGAALNSTNTDVPATWADAGNLTNTYAPNDTTWNYSIIAPESYDPGNRYWNGELNTNWDGTLDNMTTSTGNSRYHIGNYYNWAAAVAMSDSSSYQEYGTVVNQSICPAGWTLPLGGPETGNKSYEYLLTRYGWTYNTHALGNGQNACSAPLFYVLSGEWRGNSNSVGGSGSYWSSVVNGGSGSHGLGFIYDTFISPDDYFSRAIGFSVRCVAR